MPFINIKIFEGHSQERKGQIVERITDAINDITGIPKDKIWIVIEDVPPSNWAVEGKLFENPNTQKN